MILQAARSEAFRSASAWMRPRVTLAVACIRGQSGHPLWIRPRCIWCFLRSAAVSCRPRQASG